ncbi:hypothetical protein FD46_GL000339 [Liquorilactobacillus oeni DSM 19972]|uniref:Uncharacterized protein n=1 Tax=Liquorilactobacillus oeni DSM 19972 TaxID=1423777 RepID=A0A0R1MCX1_9LACO|nr:hypothetical protein FD46_GL000339 [Liquorilactobacillus oeni DSM 19972]
MKVKEAKNILAVRNTLMRILQLKTEGLGQKLTFGSAFFLLKKIIKNIYKKITFLRGIMIKNF